MIAQPVKKLETNHTQKVKTRKQEFQVEIDDDSLTNSYLSFSRYY